MIHRSIRLARIVVLVPAVVMTAGACFATRNDVRNLVGQDHYVEVFVDTPIDVCEQRDVKGMYAKARRGEITGFTGIDDPYEPPLHAEMTLDTVKQTPETNARLILEYLIEKGYARVIDHNNHKEETPVTEKVA